MCDADGILSFYFRLEIDIGDSGPWLPIGKLLEDKLHISLFRGLTPNTDQSSLPLTRKLKNPYQIYTLWMHELISNGSDYALPERWWWDMAG